LIIHNEIERVSGGKCNLSGHFCVSGYDISVIAYGQSGSGKTYTIFGPGLHCAFSETEYGIIPRVTREIFSQLTVSVIWTTDILIKG
jgi:hypothetical protein